MFSRHSAPTRLLLVTPLLLGTPVGCGESSGSRESDILEAGADGDSATSADAGGKDAGAPDGGPSGKDGEAGEAGPNACGNPNRLLLCKELARDVEGDAKERYQRTYHYDACGKHTTTDETSRAGVKSLWTYRYATDGRELTTERDDGVDGSIDVRVTEKLNSAGDVIEWNIARVMPRPFNRVYERYDDAGRRTAVGFDANGDGKADSENKFAYTTDGQLTLEDYGNTKSVTSYDARGRITSWEQDNAATMKPDAVYDGVVDRRRTYHYAAATDVDWASAEEEELVGAAFQQVEHWEQTSAGNVVTERHYLGKTSASPPIYLARRTRDGAGHTIKEEVDVDRDDTFKQVTSRTFEGDRLTRLSSSYGGKELRVETFRYDAQGRLTQYELEADGDGVIDERREYMESCTP